MIDHLLLFIVALISNIFSAFSGGGAGVIQLPAILFIFETNFVSALAVHKIATVALGMGATLKFTQVNNLENKFIFYSLIIGIPFVIIGAQLITYVDEDLAKVMLGIMIIAISVYTFFVKDFGENNLEREVTLNKNRIGYFLLCIVALLNGSLSAGTGLIFTLVLVTFFKMNIKTAIVYTLFIVGFFYNLTGAITLGVLSNINWIILPSLFIGSLLGGYLGAKLSIQKENKTIKNAFQIVTLLVGISLLT